MSDEIVSPEWTDDCQGKQNYDLGLVCLIGTYRPRGGGFTLFNAETAEMFENDTRPDIKPSAHVSIYAGEDVVAEVEFEGETEEIVKTQCETWSKAMIARVNAAIIKEFSEKT